MALWNLQFNTDAGRDWNPWKTEIHWIGETATGLSCVQQAEISRLQAASETERQSFLSNFYKHKKAVILTPAR